MKGITQMIVLFEIIRDREFSVGKEIKIKSDETT